MNPLLHLDSILSEYQPVFNYNNFNHFQTFLEFPRTICLLLLRLFLSVWRGRCKKACW